MKKRSKKQYQRRTLGPIGDFKRFRLHHKIFFTFTGIVGAVLVWRGIWTFFDKVHLFEHPIESTLAGLILVGISGFFFKLV